MKKLIFALFAGWLVACGGQELEDGAQAIDFDDAETIELATAEQELSAPSGPSRGYGLSTAATRNTCSTSSTGQSCLVPRGDKTVTYCLDGGFDSSEKTSVKAGIQQIDSALQFWTFTDVGACPNPLPDLTFVGGISVGNGPSSNAMSAFASVTPTNLASVTESVPGTWQSYAKVLVNVDNADIDARSFAIYNHVGGYAAAMFTGLGSRADTANSYTNRDVTVPGVSVSLTSGEVCKANNYSMSSSGTWAFSGTCSGD